MCGECNWEMPVLSKEPIPCPMCYKPFVKKVAPQKRCLECSISVDRTRKKDAKNKAGK